jgi:4-amino-4-deoxy-L-arabinose transferase-like glycosyltransferase
MSGKRFPSIPTLCGLLGLLLLLYAGIFAHRNVLGVDIMEARNLITAREMIETGHWFLPTMHGEPRLAKPPLPTWLTAATMIAGNSGLDTDLAVNRIPSALAGLLLAFSLFGLTRFWTGSNKAAALATAFLATSYMFVLMTRRNSWDIYCHAFMLAAIWGLAVILASPVPRRRLAVGTGMLLGLSGLSKGPVSYYALLLPFIVAMLASGGWQGMRARARDLGLALGIGVVLSTIWSAVAWLAVPHDFLRMLDTEHNAWFTEHTKPFWFYLQFPLMTGIWSLAACAALWPGHARKRVEPLLPYWRPFVWTLGSVMLLMLVPEKKDRYLLPVLIPLCQLMGVYLTGLLRDPDKGGRLGQALIAAESAIFGLVTLALPAGLWWARGRFPALNASGIAGTAAVGVLLVALLYRFCRTRNLPALFAVKFSILGLCALGLPALVQPPAGELSVPLAQIRAFAADGLPLCDSSLKFQDFWVIGSKAQRADEYAPSEPAEKICFVTRKENPFWPESLRDYATQEHLRVEDLAGKALHLIALRRKPAN